MKAHFHTLLFLIAISFGTHQAHAQLYDHCTTFDDIPENELEAVPNQLCVSFQNTQLGCDFELFDGESIPESWRDDVRQNSQKWNQLPANTTIQVDLRFDFIYEPFFQPWGVVPINPYDKTIQVNWRGETFLVELSEQTPESGGQNDSYIEGSFTFNSGEAIFDGDMSTGLEIIFFSPETEEPAYAAATWMFIEGQDILNDAEWTTTAPAVPQIILRDPPGDGSYTELLEGDETCHGHSVSISQDESNSIWGSAKLGVSGEVGFIVSAEVESYVEVSSGLEMGFTQTTLDESKLCFRVENTYSTSLDDPVLQENSGDLYIGSAITYAYGVFRSISLNGNCELIEENSLAFLPVSSNGFFIYPENYISGTLIPELEVGLETIDPNSEEYRLIADQLEVWQETIQMNAEIKESAFASQVPTTAQFLAGSTSTNSVTTTTSEIREIEYNMYIEESAAVEAGVYVSGSGGALGSQIRSKTSKGSSTNSSNVHTTEISYTFNDDDTGTGNQDGDVFAVNIYQDATFGTPIFELIEAESATSCPYEGGYSIDNPAITFTSNNGTDLTIENIPEGETHTFEVDICNESDFEREYYVKVPFESNLNGLQVNLAGTPINVSEGVTTDPIPANTCLQGVDVSISQTTGSPESVYEDVRIVIFSPCQPNFEGSQEEIVFDAYFTDAVGTNQLERDDRQVTIFPNPSKGNFSIELVGLSEVGQLQICDLTGRTVFQNQVNPREELIEIELGQVPSGIYLLSIMNREVQITRQIIIN
jgi:hypothetical protein